MTAVDLALPPPLESSADVRARVAAARHVQSERFGDVTDDTRRPVNADMPSGDIDRLASPDAGDAALLADAAVKLHLTARGYTRILKVARTIADLDGASGIRRVHVAEALSYRQRPIASAGAAGEGNARPLKGRWQFKRFLKASF